MTNSPSSQNRPADDAAPNPTATNNDQSSLGEPARRRFSWGVLPALVLLLVAAYFSMAIGVVDLKVSALWQTSSEDFKILVLSRIPRVCAVLLSGAALATAGLVMQHLAQNRFIAPTTSGTVEAAVLGLLLTMIWLPDASILVKVTLASLTSIVATLIFLRLIAAHTSRDVLLVALTGVIYGAVISAVTVFLAIRENMLQIVETWTTGSFSGAIAGTYETLWAVAIVGALMYLFADRFTVVGMGSHIATNLGVAYQSTLYIGLILVSLVAALVVTTVGAIPFLGLIIPNLVRLQRGDNVRDVLPYTAICGAGFVLVCDVLGRVLRFPYEIPASTLAGVVGAGLFMWLIWRSAAPPKPTNAPGQSTKTATPVKSAS